MPRFTCTLLNSRSPRKGGSVPDSRLEFTFRTSRSVRLRTGARVSRGAGRRGARGGASRGATHFTNDSGSVPLSWLFCSDRYSRDVGVMLVLVVSTE